MLDFLLSWSTYRTLKTGMLLDYYTKRLLFYFILTIHKTLSLFFTDKYLIEELSKNWAIFNNLVSKQIFQSQKWGFLQTFYFYFLIIAFTLVGVLFSLLFYFLKTFFLAFVLI